MTRLEKDEVCVTASDLKHLFKRSAKKLKKTALFFGIVAFFYLALQDPLYHATALFKQTGQKADPKISLKAFLQGSAFNSSEQNALSVMRSRKFLRRVVSERGLQMNVKTQGVLSRAFFNLARNLKSECRLPLDDVEQFEFRDVEYTKERAASLYLEFVDDKHFELYDQKTRVAFGACGERILSPSLAFTLTKRPSFVDVRKKYLITVTPWTDCVEQLLKRFAIKPEKRDPALLLLSFSANDRKGAESFLNDVMKSFQQELEEENRSLYEAHTRYLEKRQQEVFFGLDQVLLSQVSYMKKNLKESGFAQLKEEIKLLEPPRQKYLNRLFEIDLDLKRLEKHRLARNEKSFASYGKLGQKVAVLRPLAELGRAEKSSLARESLQAINLATSQKLYEEYQREYDALSALSRQLAFVKEGVFEPTFELSALSSVLSDPVSNEMIQNAGRVALLLKDEANRSPKEQERLKESLEVQKKFLSQHLDQMIEWHHLRKELIEDKIASLQEVSVDLLKSEKGMIEDKLQDAQKRLMTLPEKWHLENQLKLQTELGKSILQGISQLVESKTIDHHLSSIESKPLDPAVRPFKALAPHLLLLSLACGGLSACALFFVDVMRALFKGLPATIGQLKLRNALAFGPFTPHCNQALSELNHRDLDTMRHVMTFLLSRKKINEGLCASIILGKKPNFTSSLAELLSKTESKVLLIHASFDALVTEPVAKLSFYRFWSSFELFFDRLKRDNIRKWILSPFKRSKNSQNNPHNRRSLGFITGSTSEDQPGLWHYLEKKVEACPLRKGVSFDMIPSGGTTKESMELLLRPAFAALIADVKKRYDFILIFSDARACFAESSALLKSSDAAIVAAYEEGVEDFECFFTWERQLNARSLAFVAFDL